MFPDLTNFHAPFTGCPQTGTLRLCCTAHHAGRSAEEKGRRTAGGPRGWHMGGMSGLQRHESAKGMSIEMCFCLVGVFCYVSLLLVVWYLLCVFVFLPLDLFCSFLHTVWFHKNPADLRGRLAAQSVRRPWPRCWR